MKDVIKRLQKTYDKRIVDHKQVKKKWKRQKEQLMELGVSINKEDDAMYFQYEIILKSIASKALFEETFLNTYVTMYDYWYDLTYQERKRQMNIDIQQTKASMNYFIYEEQAIYMPCFDRSFNHLYTDEIVLLDLKQYHAFIRSFAKEIKFDLYGVLPFLHGFSSAHVVLRQGDDFVVYHELVNRFYLYKDSKFYKAISLDPKHVCEDSQVQQQIAYALVHDDEDALLEQILTHHLVSNRIAKQLKRYQHKKAKQLCKEEKKKK